MGFALLERHIILRAPWSRALRIHLGAPVSRQLLSYRARKTLYAAFLILLFITCSPASYSSQQDAIQAASNLEMATIQNPETTPETFFMPKFSLPINGEVERRLVHKTTPFESESATKREQCSVPMVSPPLPPDASHADITSSSINANASSGLKAEVEWWDSSNVNKLVEHLVDLHFANSPDARKLDQQVTHFRSKKQRLIAASKDSLNFSFNFRGCEPSSRAGQLILDDKVNVNDRASAEFERQRYIDKIHTQIVSAMMQVSMGFGLMEPNRRAQVINAGFKSLETLVGADQAKNTVLSLRSWLNPMKVPETTFNKTVWDTMERNEKLQEVITAALNQDLVVGTIRDKLYKVAYPSKLKKNTSKVVGATLSAVSLFTPGLIVPTAAEAALNAFVMSTGGPEEAKLRRLLLLDKRIQSRLKVLETEATLALDNYRFAQVTRNTPLLVFSEAIISDMATKPVASKVLVGEVLPQATPAVTPEIIETKPKVKKKFLIL